MKSHARVIDTYILFCPLWNIKSFVIEQYIKADNVIVLFTHQACEVISPNYTVLIHLHCKAINWVLHRSFHSGMFRLYFQPLTESLFLWTCSFAFDTSEHVHYRTFYQFIAYVSAGGTRCLTFFTFSAVSATLLTIIHANYRWL